MLREFFTKKHHQDHADEQGDQCEVVDLQADQEAGDGGADIGAHDDIDGLAQLEKTCVEKPHHHDGRGGGGLNGARHHQADQHAEQWVGGDPLEQGFEARPRHGFQAFSHELHAEQEQSQSAEQLQHVFDPHGVSSYIPCFSVSCTQT